PSWRPSLAPAAGGVVAAADALLVPPTPATLPVRTFAQLSAFVEDEVEAPPAIVAFFSMVDRRKRLHREVVEQLSTGRDDVAAAAVPAATEVELMGVERAPVVVHAPRSRAARAYTALWDEVRSRLAL